MNIDELVKKYHDEYWSGAYMKCNGDCSGAQMIRRVITEERERNALLVERWHINKGGYTTLARAIREGSVE